LLLACSDVALEYIAGQRETLREKYVLDDSNPAETVGIRPGNRVPIASRPA
jgi:hypothetical protein